MKSIECSSQLIKLIVCHETLICRVHMQVTQLSDEEVP